jgi:hypothetical protein
MVNIFNYLGNAAKIYSAEIRLSGVLAFTCIVIAANLGVWFDSQNPINFIPSEIRDFVFFFTLAFIVSLYVFVRKRTVPQNPIVDVGLCPRCRVPLFSVITLYRCEKCGGEWKPSEL